MENINNIEKSFEEEPKDSNVDRLLYLKQQKDIVERARQSIEKSKQVAQLQKDVITLSYEKWDKVDSSVKSVQEDIDWYVKEYIIPIQEREQELDKLENSLINIPEKHGIVGRVGKFFERLIPGITKEGRQRRNIADKKQTLEKEIETYKFMIEKNPFEIFGANKDIKSQLIAKVDVTQLDKYSTMQNDPKNYLKPNNSVKSIADSVKIEDMTNFLKSYPSLEDEADYLTSELINNGIEAFSKMANQIARDNIQKKNDLITKIDFETQENDSKDIQENADKDIQEDVSKDILDRITQQIQSIMNNLTPEELDELKRRDSQYKPANELDDKS